VVGNELAKEYSFKNAAETLVKIPYTYPEASEGEVSLLRGAQIYLQHLNQPQTALQLLQHFWQKYPESQWMPQVERAWKMAQHQLALAAEEARQAAEREAEAAAPASSAPVRVRPRAVAPTLGLDPVKPSTPSKRQAAPPPAGSGSGSAPRPSGH
jgi:outer membrane protein assembly factor BamD (BamD/ComL family)